MKQPKKPIDIPMMPVESSAIAATGYDPATRRMRVQFHSGHTYDYFDVGADKHLAMRLAPSIGRHFHQHVLGKHEHTRISQAA